MLFYFYDLKFWISFAVFKVFPFLHLETLIYFLYFKSKQSERWHLWILEIYDLKNFSLPFYRSFQITLKLGFLLHFCVSYVHKGKPLFQVSKIKHFNFCWKFMQSPSYDMKLLQLSPSYFDAASGASFVKTHEINFQSHPLEDFLDMTT